MPRQPLTFDTVRELGATLPGAEESTTYGSPALKVKGRLIACIPTHKSAEPNSLVLSIDYDARAALLAEAPHAYYLPAHYVNYPLILVRLTQIDREQLRDLLTAAHRFASTQSQRKKR